MESIGAFPEGDWESLGKMFSAEDIELTPHFLGQCSFNPNSLDTTIEGTINFGQSLSFFPNNNMSFVDPGVSSSNTESLFHTLDSLNSNLQYLSQESGYSTSTNSGSQESYYFSDNSCHINPVTNNDISIVSVPIFLMDHHEKNYDIPAFSDHTVMGDQNVCNVDENCGDSNHLKRVYDSGAEDKANAVKSSSPNPKKKPRVPRDVQKNKKNAKSQATPAQSGKLEEEISNTSSYSSEDDNASQENNGGESSDGKAPTTAVNLNGKARACRGSATDPQSLYARKRRERINERLRILQNLVPNGTKVDISTMLEEAVHYVKFLQLQIKLLSSDDMWMYAPIAYNGMDIGLSRKLSQLV